ncbi:MAG: hypothetical protein ACQKBT_08550 [Puniceicoccales bacterium]
MKRHLTSQSLDRLARPLRRLYREEGSSGKPEGFSLPPGRYGVTVLSGLAVALLLLSGCSTYNDEVESVRQSWTVGQWDKAAAKGEKLGKNKDSHRNEVLLGLEEGTLLRAANRIPQSEETYEETWRDIQAMDQKADFRISQASIALLVNPGLTLYEARTYDRIMLHTYSALNYLTLGDYENARVSLNRSYNSQQLAVAENSKRISKTQAAIDEKKDSDESKINVSKIENNPVTQQKLSNLYGPIRSMEAYGPYVNPFAVYLDGLYFLNQGVDASDLERGLKSMERVANLVPGSPWLQSEYTLAQDIINGKGQPDSVIVLLETGLSPMRVAKKIELPLFLFGIDNVPYFAASFPVLEFQPNYPRHAIVTTGQGSRPTEILSDMDKVIAQEFRDHESLIVSQAILSAATKAATLYIARSQAKDGSSTQAIIDIFGIFYQAITNQPDLRTWFTLPKQIQGIRVPMPEDRTLQVGFAGSNQKVEVRLIDGKIVVVHIRVTATATNPVIQQFALQ